MNINRLGIMPYSADYNTGAKGRWSCWSLYCFVTMASIVLCDKINLAWMPMVNHTGCHVTIIYTIENVFNRFKCIIHVGLSSYNDYSDRIQMKLRPILIFTTPSIVTLDLNCMFNYGISSAICLPHVLEGKYICKYLFATLYYRTPSSVAVVMVPLLVRFVSSRIPVWLHQT